MSDLNANPGDTGNDMDIDAPFIRQQFSGAVETITPDIGALVAGGATAGRELRRRRRMQVVAGVTTAAVVVVTAFATGSVAKLVNADDAGPADDTLQQLEPATPRGLAAAVMEHTASLGSLIAVGGNTTDPKTDQLSIGLGYRTTDGTAVEIDVIASVDAGSLQGGGKDLCDSTDLNGATCVTTEGDDGATYTVFTQVEDSGSVMSVVKVDDSGYVALIESVPTKGADFPWDSDDVLDVLADPAVGLQTTKALNDKGANIADFQDDLNESSGSGSDSASAGPISSAAPPASEGSSDNGDSGSGKGGN